jgi:hypothetical protein
MKASLRVSVAKEEVIIVKAILIHFGSSSIGRVLLRPLIHKVEARPPTLRTQQAMRAAFWLSAAVPAETPVAGLVLICYLSATVVDVGLAPGLWGVFKKS